MVTLSLVWLLMEKQELWLVIAMMYLQKDDRMRISQCISQGHCAVRSPITFCNLTKFRLDFNKYVKHINPYLKAKCGAILHNHKANEADKCSRHSRGCCAIWPWTSAIIKMTSTPM